MVFNYINIRTFITVAVSLISCYLSFQYSWRLHFSVVLLGLAIAFPLSQSIQMAFKRRERALEYLSLFNAGLLAIHYSFESSEDLTPEKKAEAKTLLNETSEKLLEQLKAADGSISKLKLLTDSITHFVLQNREHISKRVQIRIVRYLKDVIDGSVYVLSLTTHRTMLGLRILAITFINFFAVLHPPMLVYQLSDQMPVWVLYVVSALGPLLLITLYNFQAHIEYPFDQKGTDDVKLDEFKLKL